MQLLYDPTRKMIAIKPEIPHDKPCRYPVERDEDLKALVFSLNKPAK